MERWIIEFGQSAVIALVLNTIPRVYRTWTNPKKRRKVKNRAAEIVARFGGILSPDQKKRYREMRTHQLTKELRRLVLFSRAQEMQAFSKIFSSFASAGANFLILCIFGSVMGLSLAAWVLSTLAVC